MVSESINRRGYMCCVRTVFMRLDARVWMSMYVRAQYVRAFVRCAHDKYARIDAKS